MNNAFDVITGRDIRTGRLRNGSDPVVIHRLVCLDDNIVALTHSDGNVVGGKWDDGHEVTGNDRQVMVVYRESEVSVHSRVHEADPILLPTDKLCLEPLTNCVTITVDPNIGHINKTRVYHWCSRVSDLVHVHFIERAMRPVIEKQHTEVFVVLSCRRAMNHNAAKHSLPCLKREMRMIEACPILLGPPGIGVTCPWGNWTLGNRDSAVHLVIEKLSDPMKMNTGAIVFQIVFYMNLDGVSPVCLHGGAWILAIDEHHGSIDAIGGSCGIGDVKPVLSHNTCVRGFRIVVGIDIELLVM